MEKLTKTEEPIMQTIWSLKKVFIKDIIEALPAPKPPYNTISSIVRILEGKEMVAHEAFGRTYRYYAKVSKSEYRKRVFSSLVKDYFDGSYSDLMSFIIKDNDLSEKEENELKQIINKHYDQ